MKVTLIHATPGAEDVLIFTKNTRLNMSPEGLDEIRSWPQERKFKELEYMATTLPSSWEFVDLIFAIEGVTRAFTHQLVRTRTGSYAQQAMRVANMSDFRYLTGPTIERNMNARDIYNDGMVAIKEAYSSLLKIKGVLPEDARGILPTNIHTNIVAKFNLRSFCDLVRKRSSGRVQEEYAEVVEKMVLEVTSIWPWSLMFIRDQKFAALERLTNHFKTQLKIETENGAQTTETNAWKSLKDLDLIRNMM